MLSIAEVDQSMAKNDLFANIPIPVRSDFFIFRILPEDIFKLFLGLIQYNLLKLLEEFSNLSFTQSLKLWFNRRGLGLFQSSKLIQEMFKIDLSPNPSSNNINNRIMSLIYKYYEDYAVQQEKKDNFSYNNIIENIKIFIKQPDLEKLDKLQNFSKLVLRRINNDLTLSINSIQNKKVIDISKKPFLTIYLKDGSEKVIPVKYVEMN
jgi:hypothetical protein